MDRIKTKYWIMAGAVILIGVVFTLFNRHYQILTSEESNLFIALLALIIAILSIGIADGRPHRFNGTVVISRSYPTTAGGKVISWQVVFEVRNQSQQPMEGLLLRFRIPSAILAKPGDQGFRIYHSGETTIAVSDAMGFLGTEKEDRTVSFYHDLKLNEWNKGNIYVSVSAHGHAPRTFCWKRIERDKVMKKGEDKLNYNLPSVR